MLGRFHQRYGHRFLSSVAVPTLKSDSCTDNMKYHLLNAVKSCRYTDRETYTEQRQALFMDMPSILTDNRGSPQKAENLYVVLYAQFCTMRTIVERFHGRRFKQVDDKTIKQNFRELIHVLPDFVDDETLRKHMLSVIKMNVDQKEHKYYRDALDYTLGREPTNKSKIGQDKKKLFAAFMAGSRRTDIYIRTKLQADADTFFSRKSKILAFFQRHQYANEWITATGIWILGFGTSFLSWIFS